MRTEPAFQTDAIYRANFEAQLLALHPASVLDVGCGTGDLMHRLAALGIRAAGIDPNAERVAALRDAGFDVQIGSGEALPFAEQSFDVVVAQYVPHHCADWPAALAQMLRVAQRAVLVLEQWYDPSLLSQRVAAAYDAWCKAIDRAAGMVHHEPPTAAQLCAGATGAAGVRVSLAWWLRPYHEPLAEYENYAEGQIAKAADRAAARAGWERIRADAQVHGLSGEGAVCLTLMKGG
jgi:ubiquinone/menaquinone biosynthesis C-methylase UbiE